MTCASKRLEEWLASECGQPAEPAVQTCSDAIRRRHRYGVAAVLFYGSCLRKARHGGDVGEGVLDFYLLVDSYRQAYSSWWLRLVNSVLPPNVFYIEVPWQDRLLRVKYAVITTTAFVRATSPRSFFLTLCCRFAQPVQVVYTRDEAARRQVVAALRSAVVTVVQRAASLFTDRFTAAELWIGIIEESYRSEFRAEGLERARLIYQTDRERYERLTPWALMLASVACSEPQPGGGFALTEPPGLRRRLTARLLCVSRRQADRLATAARLIKAVFTFEGAQDYVLWKVKRHSSVSLSPTPFERRHPLLSWPSLIWRLYRRGGFR
ncbi:MAG: hypothetical protein ACE5I7_20825 [Candidatus Binatia bacterium]